MARRWIVAQSDALEALRKMPDQSVHMAMTSPPYFGLRAYKGTERIWDVDDPACGNLECEHVWGSDLPPHHPGQVDETKWKKAGASSAAEPSGNFCTCCGAWRGSLGAEPSLDLYIQHLVLIFRELRRVLRDDGTFWLNIGDAWAGSGKGPTGWNGFGDQTRYQGFNSPGAYVPVGMKPKDVMGIPWTVAFALRADGWYLRAPIIWQKPNAKPGSQQDRPTIDYEYVFLLSKNAEYFYDEWAVREPSQERGSGNSGQKFVGTQHRSSSFKYEADSSGRTKRSVWSIPARSSGYPHYSTYPEALVEPCIKAGTSEYGCCPICGTGFVRIIERIAEEVNPTEGARQQVRSDGAQTGGTERVTLGKTEKVRRVMNGWKPGCRCYPEGAPRSPAIVCDPFCGLSTTGVVALKLGRTYVGIDLSPDFVAESKRRLSLLVEVQNLPATLSAQR